MKLSTCVLTHNSELLLEACLESIIPYTDEIVIIDDVSADNTVNIAKKYTDKIIIKKLERFDEHRNLGINNCSGDWILMLDSDEIISNKIAEVKDVLNVTDADLVGLPRCQIVNISPLLYKIDKYSYPDFQWRLFRNNKSMRYCGKVHENIYALKDNVLQNMIIGIHLFHFNLILCSESDWLDKMIKYESMGQTGIRYPEMIKQIDYRVFDKEEINKEVYFTLNNTQFKRLIRNGNII